MHTLAMFGFGGMAGIHHKVLTNDYDKIKVKGVYDIDKSRMDAAIEKGMIAYSYDFIIPGIINKNVHKTTLTPTNKSVPTFLPYLTLKPEKASAKEGLPSTFLIK